MLEMSLCTGGIRNPAALESKGVDQEGNWEDESDSSGIRAWYGLNKKNERIEISREMNTCVDKYLTGKGIRYMMDLSNFMYQIEGN